MTESTTTVVVDGKSLAQDIRSELAAEVASLVEAGHRPPCLAVVLVGDGKVILPQLRDAGFPEPERLDAEGRPVDG